jgi:hypothetical protein
MSETVVGLPIDSNPIYLNYSIMKKMLLVSLALVASVAISDAQIIYVDAGQADNSGAGTTWATAKKDLQPAINLATTGQQVWVKAGTYKPAVPGGDRYISFSMKNGVEIYGGFIGTETLLSQRNEIYNLTILSGDLNGDDGPNYANYGENSAIIVNNTQIDNTAVLDGFTITGASLGPNGSMAMFNNESSPIIKNTLFLNNNTTAMFNQGSLAKITSSPAVINCVFYKNNLSLGSAIYNSFSSLFISNCIFTENVGEGAIYSDGNFHGESITILNSTITGNHKGQTTGGAFLFRSDMVVQNSIFYNNEYDDPHQIQDINFNSQSTLSFSYSMRDLLSAGKGVIFSSPTPPRFVNAADPDGPDNLWRTADDGLRLQCNSPVINKGKNTYCDGEIPSLDILGLPRTGIYDMGAYEGGFADQAVDNIAPENTTILFDQNATGTTNYATCSNLVATLNSSDTYTVAGSVSAKVWIEASQPTAYVKRHYELTPASNALAATGKVTLYFTQQEFDDFNAANDIKLPLNAADAENYKENLRIEKRVGTSSNGTGLPDTYPTDTSPVTLTPSAANGSVVWNGTASRWEVSFEVTGFSGFFVKTVQTALPLRLMGFSGTQETSANNLQWETADEVNTKSFELESSTDGRNFKKVATIDAVSTGDNSYGYKDHTTYKGITYYRLKMVDLDGSFSYSRIVWLSRDGKGSINIYPNPVNYLVNLSLDSGLVNSQAKLYDASGTLIKTISITSNEQKINVRTLPSGLYILKFKDGSVGSFAKQ